jgi:hypothetical protein
LLTGFSPRSQNDVIAAALSVLQTLACDVLIACYLATTPYKLLVLQTLARDVLIACYLATTP